MNQARDDAEPISNPLEGLNFWEGPVVAGRSGELPGKSGQLLGTSGRAENTVREVPGSGRGSSGKPCEV